MIEVSIGAKVAPKIMLTSVMIVMNIMRVSVIVAVKVVAVVMSITTHTSPTLSL
jgi:hypothetical protein